MEGTRERKIEVKVMDSKYKYVPLFKVNVPDFDAVQEIDDFVSKYLPLHRMEIRYIYKDEKDEKEATDGDNEARD